MSRSLCHAVSPHSMHGTGHVQQHKYLLVKSTTGLTPQDSGPQCPTIAPPHSRTHRLAQHPSPPLSDPTTLTRPTGQKEPSTQSRTPGRQPQTGVLEACEPPHPPTPLCPAA